jgi:diguanylate cyclase (GGDEF)-like protein
MTPLSAPTAHALRRTLIVRDGPGLAELADALRRSVDTSRVRLDEVDSVFEALAETADSTATGATPVATIAVGLRHCGDDPSAVVTALRRVHPEARVVLFAPRGLVDTVDGAGFDEVVALPASSRDLAAALQIEDETAEGRDALRGPPERIPPSGPAYASPVMPAERLAPLAPLGSTSGNGTGFPAGLLSGDRDVVEMVIDDAMQAFAARRERTPPAQPVAQAVQPHDPTVAATTNTDGIGDSDLVDAILDGGDRVVAMALQLIRTELGCEDLRLGSPQDLLRDERPREARVAVRWRGTTLGCLLSQQVAANALAPWADWLAHWLRLDRAHEELRVLAWTDELTGAGNRRAFERVIDATIAEARGERRPVSIMYFDIDNFKLYNDRFGHDAGDEVLREVVELLRAVIRRGDHVFRVGGDEFVVIFADYRGPRGGAANLQGGTQVIESVETIAHRFRDRVCDLKLPQLGLDAPGTVSVSAGVATYPWDGHDARSLLSHADQLALQSKRSGKNTITFGPGAQDHCCDG